jgi:hypothetical protein
MKKRFIEIYSQKGLTEIGIFVDTLTGINYLLINKGFGVGLVPLLNSDGMVVVSKEYIRNE